MDEDDELRNLKWMLGACFVFLVLAWVAFDEIKYAWSGQTVDARIVAVREAIASGRRGRTYPVLEVRYTFTDSGTTRTETDDMPIDWRPSGGTLLEAGQPLAITYRPGVENASRPVGREKTLILLLFFAALAALLGGFGWLWHHAYQQVHAKPIRRRR